MGHRAKYEAIMMSQANAQMALQTQIADEQLAFQEKTAYEQALQSEKMNFQNMELSRKQTFDSTQMQYRELRENALDNIYNTQMDMNNLELEKQSILTGMEQTKADIGGLESWLSNYSKYYNLERTQTHMAGEEQYRSLMSDIGMANVQAASRGQAGGQTSAGLIGGAVTNRAVDYLGEDLTLDDDNPGGLFYLQRLQQEYELRGELTTNQLQRNILLKSYAMDQENVLSMEDSISLAGQNLNRYIANADQYEDELTKKYEAQGFVSTVKKPETVIAAEEKAAAEAEEARKEAIKKKHKEDYQKMVDELFGTATKKET
jgi:hypothetical protein